MESETNTAFKQWMILELRGHRRLAGLVTEETIAGAAFLRLDVPMTQTELAVTQYYSPGAVYCMTPVSEEIAREVAKRERPVPVMQWEYPALTHSDPRDALFDGGGRADAGGEESDPDAAF